MVVRLNGCNWIGFEINRDPVSQKLCIAIGLWFVQVYKWI